MDPLFSSIQFEKAKQQLIPQIVQAVASNRGDQRMQAAELLQNLLQTEELLKPVRDALVKEQRRKNPIDVLDRLNDLQSNILYLGQPARRLHEAQLTIIRYLQDIGFDELCPNLFQGYGDRIAKCDRIDSLIEFFNQKYKAEFLDIQIAVQQNLIQNELDFHRWVKQGKPVKFEMGKRTAQKHFALSSLPSVRPVNWECDASFRPDALAPRPQVIVREVR